MSEFTFTDEDAPATVRKVEANPFDAPVKSLVADSGKSKSFITKNDEKELAKIRRQLTTAGETHGVTVRWVVAPQEDATKAKVSFYAVSKIVRKPKPVADATPAPAPAEKAPKTGK